MIKDVKGIRELRGITKSDAAKKMGISLKSLYNYEHGRAIPSNVIIKMSKLYNCSCDCLLGLKDYTTITAVDK